MSDIGRTLIIIGGSIVVLGIVLSVTGKIPFIGKLPGDIYIKKDGFTFYFPLATCILLSIILSIIVRMFNK